MKLSLVLLCTILSMISYSQTIEIPDQNFEKTLIELEIDSDNIVNGKILISDALKVTFLDVSGKKIKSLKGIEGFTSLTHLDCSNNPITSLDVSQNIGLTTFFRDVNDLDLGKSVISFNWFD